MSESLTEDLRALLGDEGFFTLVETFGGTRLYIAKSSDGTQVSEVLGEAAAARLADTYGGNALRIPLARTLRARHYRAQGLSNPQIARRLGLAVTGVEKLFSRHPTKRPPRQRFVDPRQSDLFS